jgi:hypothetical protein
MSQQFTTASNMQSLFWSPAVAIWSLVHGSKKEKPANALPFSDSSDHSRPFFFFLQTVERWGCTTKIFSGLNEALFRELVERFI